MSWSFRPQFADLAQQRQPDYLKRKAALHGRQALQRQSRQSGHGKRQGILMGIVNRAEADAAAGIASTTSGVQGVVKLFEYLD
jgi:osmotically-inducible protein OsmY